MNPLMIQQHIGRFFGSDNDERKECNPVYFSERYAFNDNHIIKINKYFGLSEIFKYYSTLMLPQFITKVQLS